VSERSEEGVGIDVGMKDGVGEEAILAVC